MAVHRTTCPGYGPIGDETVRQSFGDCWSAEIPSAPGVGLTEITDAIQSGRVKALQIIGDSPNFTNGEMAGFLEAVQKLEFLIVQDVFPSDITELADLVLPSATFAEKDGTYTNMERRVQLLRPAIGPKGEEEADWRIIAQIATRMGSAGFDYESAEDIFDEINDRLEIYGGISYQRLQSGGLQWPCLAADMADTPIVHAGGFEERKVRLGKLNLVDAPVHENAEYPLLLARGRVLHQPEQEMEIVQLNGRNTARRDEIIEMHQYDATEMGVLDGDAVEVAYLGGRVRGYAQLSGNQQGLVSITTLFGELITQLDSTDMPDPMLKVPGLPLVPARLEKATDQAAAD